MKNKIELKKYVYISVLTIIVTSFVFVVMSYFQYKIYTNNFNKKIEMITQKVLNEYPNINKNELVKLLNSTNLEDINLFREYGIDLEKDSIILENDRYSKKFLISNISIILVGFILIIANFLIYNKKKDDEIEEITRYIEEINKRNYKLNIDDNTEDELSILKNELYKITVMLKEQAENSKEDKIKLKDSLSDISHQLKTPLTSILIMLDNIIDNPDMQKEIKEDFIRDIKRKILNINFLVQALLKLSKFDTNTIIFIDKKVQVKEILKNAINNISVLIDLKDVNIEMSGDMEKSIYCDFKWQVEAITNILKNAVEYSNIGDKININFTHNKLFSEIIIKDSGKGISREDLSHIFERFYKGKNSSNDSIGIGLALAKAIIEKDNGQVLVESEINKGTTFIIKYFNN